MTKLTNQEVAELRGLIKASAKKLMPLSKKYGVSYQKLWAWCNGKSTGAMMCQYVQFERIAEIEFGFRRNNAGQD